MEQPLTYTGQWWLPERPAQRMMGDLTVHDGLIELSLEIAIDEAQDLPSEIPVVWGAAGGQKMTLVSCRQLSGWPLGNAFQVADVLIGEHLRPDATAFFEATIQVDGLADWLPARGLQFSSIANAPPGQPMLTVSYTAEAALQAKLMDGTGVRVGSYPRYRLRPGQANIATGATVSFRPRKAIPLSTYALSYVVPFQELVTWATQTPALIIDARVRQTARRDPLRWLRAWREGAMPAGDRNASNIRFYASNLVPDFGSGLRAWMQLRKRCNQALGLHISLLFAAPRYMDTQLILVAQALEAYHRSMYPNRQWSASEFRLRKKRVLDRFDESEVKDLQPWIQQLLHFANEPTLERRLADLQHRADPVLKELFEIRPRWAQELKDMRNKYTHRGPRSPGYGGVELSHLTRFGRLVLDVSLMLDLGIPVDLCRTALHRWGDYGWAMAEARGQ